MREPISTIAPIAAVAGVLGLCCGLPLLLSVGVVGAIAGWSLQSWALIGLGLLVAVVGGARWANGKRRRKACYRPASAPPVDGAHERAVDRPVAEGRP